VGGGWGGGGWCSQLKAPFCCEGGTGGRESFVSLGRAPHATAEVRPPAFDLKPGALAALSAPDCRLPSKEPLGCEAPAKGSAKRRAGRAGGLPGPLLAPSPGPGGRRPRRAAGPCELCAARRGFWQYVWFDLRSRSAVSSPIHFQYRVPCPSDGARARPALCARARWGWGWGWGFPGDPPFPVPSSSSQAVPSSSSQQQPAASSQ
jgi:hypothetical protein